MLPSTSGVSHLSLLSASTRFSSKFQKCPSAICLLCCTNASICTPCICLISPTLIWDSALDVATFCVQPPVKTNFLFCQILSPHFTNWLKAPCLLMFPSEERLISASVKCNPTLLLDVKQKSPSVSKNLCNLCSCTTLHFRAAVCKKPIRNDTNFNSH